MACSISTGFNYLPFPVTHNHGVSSSTMAGATVHVAIAFISILRISETHGEKPSVPLAALENGPGYSRPKMKASEDTDIVREGPGRPRHPSGIRSKKTREYGSYLLQAKSSGCTVTCQGGCGDFQASIRDSLHGTQSDGCSQPVWGKSCGVVKAVRIFCRRLRASS
jgi:hypothetical protein